MVCSLVSIYLIAHKLAYNKNKLFKTLDYWSRDMPKFDFLEKGLGIVFHHILCMIFQEKCFSVYALLTDQISLPDYIYFLKYWKICVLQLLFNYNQWQKLFEKLLFKQSFSSSLPPLTMFRKRRQNLYQARLQGPQHCIGGEGGFLNTFFKIPITFCHWSSEIFVKKKVRCYACCFK